MIETQLVLPPINLLQETVVQLVVLVVVTIKVTQMVVKDLQEVKDTEVDEELVMFRVTMVVVVVVLMKVVQMEPIALEW